MGGQTGVDSALTQSTTKINVTTKVKNKQQAMKQKLLMTAVSLLVLAQVALADTWDGVTYT